jgi:hypothetical protein
MEDKKDQVVEETVIPKSLYQRLKDKLRGWEGAEEKLARAGKGTIVLQRIHRPKATSKLRKQWAIQGRR